MAGRSHTRVTSTQIFLLASSDMVSKQQNHIILLQESFECCSILKICQSWQLATQSAFFLVKFLWLTAGDIMLWISLFRQRRCLQVQGLWFCETHTFSPCIKQPYCREGRSLKWCTELCTPGHFTGQANQVDLTVLSLLMCVEVVSSLYLWFAAKYTFLAQSIHTGGRGGTMYCFFKLYQKHIKAIKR